MSFAPSEGLEKNYGKIRALNGLDLEAKEATVLGLLGRTVRARLPRFASSPRS